MRFLRSQHQRRQVLLCPLLLAASQTAVAAAAMAAAVGQSVGGISRDFWWWLALGLSGLFVALLMLLLLFSWTRSLAASDAVPASPRHNGCHELGKPNDVRPFDGEPSSPAMIAARRGSHNLDVTHCDAGGAAARVFQHAHHAKGRSDVEMGVAVFDGCAVPPSPVGERPASRRPTTTVTAMLLPGRTQKRAESASTRRLPSDDHRRTAAAVPQRGEPATPPRSLNCFTLPADSGLPKQFQLPALGRLHHCPNGLSEVRPEADVGNTVNSSASWMAAADHHDVERSALGRGAGRASRHLRFEAVPGNFRVTGDTPRDTPAGEGTSRGALASAREGNTAVQPTPNVLPQEASAKLKRCTLPNALRQYYVGVPRVQDALAAAASPVRMPERRSSQAGQCPIERRSKLVPSGSHQTPFTGATTTAVASVAPTSSTSHGGAVLNPLTLTSAPMHTAAGPESGDTASLTDLESFARKRHATDADGVSATGPAARRSSARRESQRFSSHSQSKLRMELFRAGGEGGPAAVRTPVSGAHVDRRPLPQLHSAEERPALQQLMLYAAPAPTCSRPRRHRRDRQLLSQPLARSRASASSSPVALRRASAGCAAAKRSASATVTKGVPQLFFGQRGTSPGRPADAAALSQPTAALANGALNSRSSAAAQRPPIPKTLVGDHLTQAPAPAGVASTLFPSVSSRPRALAAAATANSIPRGKSTTATAAAAGGAPIKPPSQAAAPRRSSLSFSMSGRSPLRCSPGHMRSSSLVTFLDQKDIGVGGGPREGPAAAPLAQDPQLPTPRRGSARSSSLSYASPGAGGYAGAARLGRLSDPLAPAAAAPALAASAPATVEVTAARGHRRLGRPEATAGVEGLQAKSPAASEPSAAATATPPHSVTTATPLELPTDVAARRTPAALAPPASLVALQQGYGAAGESGDAASGESLDGDDGDSTGSEASTIAAGMLPDAPRRQRGWTTTMPSDPTAAVNQQQRQRSAAPAYSAPRQRPSYSFGIQVLRITQPTGEVQESFAPSSVLAQCSPHRDMANIISSDASTTPPQYLLASSGGTALPTPPPFSGPRVAQASGAATAAAAVQVGLR
ncbi:hypothetical protein LSCM1_07987 [Leishmania martiniquensis]|uniref:Proteophosphoglycan ppg4 n=1 Tax=Leishmania martiniquensis TaxID=1580590 RepID=A0A836I2A9_9TRYP|nr:hypothetical protein LSCM1_07987 [Leishmania martiniquensis]